MIEPHHLMYPAMMGKEMEKKTTGREEVVR